MLTEAFISHSTSERLRVKVPGKKGDASYFSALASRFSGLPGVRHVEANPITGSVLLLIEPGQGIELEPRFRRFVQPQVRQGVPGDSSAESGAQPAGF